MIVPKQPKSGSLRSKITPKKQSDGKFRYETTVPIEVAELKGNWEIEVMENNVIEWKRQ